MKKQLFFLSAIVAALVVHFAWPSSGPGGVPTDAVADLRTRIDWLADEALAVVHDHPEAIGAISQAQGGFEPRDMLYVHGLDLPSDFVDRARAAFPGVTFTWDLPADAGPDGADPWQPDDLALLVFSHAMWVQVERGPRMPMLPAHEAEVAFRPGAGADGAHRVVLPGSGRDGMVDFTTHSTDGRLTEIRIVALSDG